MKRTGRAEKTAAAAPSGPTPIVAGNRPNPRHVPDRRGSGSSGKGSMRLVVFAAGVQRNDVACEDQAVYIGSRETCRIHLPDEHIPDQLAVIYRESDDVWVLERLTPGCELLVNDQNVERRVLLRNGDRIRVHDFVIRAFVDPTAVHRNRPAGRSTVESLTRFARFQLPPGSILRKAEEVVEARSEHLTRIGQLAVAVSGCETVERFMDVAIQQLLEMFAAQRVWLGVRRVNYGAMDFVEGRTITGHACELPSIGHNIQPRVLDRGQFLFIPDVSAEEPFSVLAGPLLGPEGTLGMVYLDTGDLGRRFELADLDLLCLALNVLGAHLDALFKHLMRVRAAMIDGEVTVAHAIQAQLTPRKLPQWDTLQFGAFREPGRERTSDIYDVVRLSNQMAALMVGHTRATGPLPGMVMAQAQAAFRSAAMHLDAPHILLKMLNVVLFDPAEQRPLEMFAAIIDPPTGRIRYAVAGEIGAAIIGHRGEERRLVPTPPTPALGVARDSEYEILSARLEPGETLVLYTPGVVTARNRAGETFGEDRFINILCDGFGQQASAMLKEMLSDLRNFTEEGSQPDDITVLLAHRP